MCRSERQIAPLCTAFPLLLRATCALLVGAIVGCEMEMADQPRYEPYEPSPVFSNGLSSRTPVPGTVARGQLQSDSAFFTGKEGGELVTELPEQSLKDKDLSELLARGQDRFNVFCSQCHGQVGGGTGGSEEMLQAVGMVVKRGFPLPPTYHQERLRRAPLGHFFDVITNGQGRMPAHGYLVPTEDRWAIAAYIRALQLSQHALEDQLSPEDLENLTESAPQDGSEAR